MREKYGRHFLRVGFAGVGVLVLAFCLTSFALANGVHCPGCDRHSLTDAQFAFWDRYFAMKDGVYGLSVVLLGVASPFASPRRWPFVIALALAVFAFALTPL